MNVCKRLTAFILAMMLSITMTACGGDSVEPQEQEAAVVTPVVEEGDEVEQKELEIADEDEKSEQSEDINEESEEVPEKFDEIAVPATELVENKAVPTTAVAAKGFSNADVPAYSGSPYAVINGNTAYFSASELEVGKSFERYSALDGLSRCGVAYANIGEDIMPTEERGAIGSVKPSGWQTVKYDIVDGKYLYNRCHLIGFQLSGENANTANLITGTRYMNVQGMLPFENMVADYIKESGNHVLYRVTPIFEGNNLLASGVLMEAQSIEDEGDGISFCVYCYNVQPGIDIDYATGNSSLSASAVSKAEAAEKSTSSVQKAAQTTQYSVQVQQSVAQTATDTVYILNTNTKKFHYPSCSSAKDIKEKNRSEYNGEAADLISQGFTACKRCNPR